VAETTTGIPGLWGEAATAVTSASTADGRTMKAISLWQPWATLIAIGAKRIETRSWMTYHRGPLAIAATKSTPADAKTAALFNGNIRRSLQDARLWRPGEELALPEGCVLCTARLVDVRPVPDRPTTIAGVTIPPPEPELSFGHYAPRRFAWLLADVVQLAEPVPCAGGQRLWDWRRP
jgi:activating signal cointegrator 1